MHENKKGKIHKIHHHLYGKKENSTAIAKIRYTMVNKGITIYNPCYIIHCETHRVIQFNNVLDCAMFLYPKLPKEATFILHRKGVWYKWMFARGVFNQHLEV